MKRIILWGYVLVLGVTASWGLSQDRSSNNPSGPAAAREGASASSASEDIFARGTLTKIQGGVLVLAQRVSVSPSTGCFRERQKIAMTDLKPGAFIALRGTTAPDGSVQANEVRELPSPPEDYASAGQDSEGAGKKKKGRLRGALGRAMGGLPVGGYPSGRPYPVGDPRGPGGMPGSPEVGVGVSDSDGSPGKQPARPGAPLPGGFIVGKLGESSGPQFTLLRDVLADADTFIIEGDRQISFDQLRPGQQVIVRGTPQSRRFVRALMVRVESSPEAPPSGNGPASSPPVSSPGSEKP